MASGGSADLNIDLQILDTLQDISRQLGSGSSRGGGSGGLLGGGINLGGAGGDLLGKFNRLAVVVTATVAVFRLLEGAARGAAATLQSFANTQFGLASSGSTTALLRTLGRSLGISDVAGLGAGIHGASLSPMGVMTGGKYGLGYRPYETGGATDRGEMMLKLIEGLRATARTSRSAAIADARNLNAEALLPLTLVSEKTFQELRQHSRLLGGIFGEARLKAGAEFNVKVAMLGDSFDALKTLLGFSMIPAIQLLTDVTLFLVRLLAAKAGIPDAEVEQRIREQYQAVRANTAALNKLSGIYGGGQGIRSAMPGAFGIGAGFELGRQLRAGNIRFGAYSVGM